MHIAISNPTPIDSDNGLQLVGTKPISEPMRTWTPRNRLQWNIYRNSNIFLSRKSVWNVIWKMAFILFRPQCVRICREQSRPRQIKTIISQATFLIKFCWMNVIAFACKFHWLCSQWSKFTRPALVQIGAEQAKRQNLSHCWMMA